MITEFITHRDDRCDLWVGQKEGEPDYVFEGFLKVEGGVKHVINRFDNIPSQAEMLALLESIPWTSPRPYKPGQACDGSIGSCALALFHDFCGRCGFDAVGLYKAAHAPEETGITEQHQVTIALMADWQGVAYPRSWTIEEFVKLLNSLHEVNQHALAGMLEEAVEVSRIYFGCEVKKELPK